MGFEWDWRKAETNRRKHGIDFADAALALHDDHALTVPDETNPGRFVTVGMDDLGRVVVVVFTWCGDRVRLISARKATRRERRQCEGRDKKRI